MQNYRDIVNYVSEAVGEMGYDPYVKDEYPDLVKRARRNSPQDVGGWLADEFYNDSEIVSGLVADRLFDLIVSVYKEDPRDSSVWEKHLAEVNKLMPHVTLS
jgi:hypothetical protein